MDLAIFSGAPHFTTPQHVGGPIVEKETRERFHALADSAFDRNYLTNGGPLSQKLEEEIAARHECGNAVFMANATVAQMMLMKAVGAVSGEALVSANTFIATAHVCQWLGVRPVFCDLDPETLNLDPGDAEKRITSETRAVIPTHVFGVLADMPALVELCGRHGLVLLADAAHAFDCTGDGVFPGGFGAPEFLSFHATKYFGTFEGGAVLTNDSSLASELRFMRNFGFNRPGDVGLPGLNAKGSEISAAFGLASLPALERRRERLFRIREIYMDRFAGVPGLRIHPLDVAGRNNYRYFAMFVEDAFPLSRDVLWQVLRHENVMVRRYFYPGCHRMSFYRDESRPVLPRTDDALDRIISLPTSFVDVDPEKAAGEVADIVLAARDKASRVEDWWRRVGHTLPLSE